MVERYPFIEKQNFWILSCGKMVNFSDLITNSGQFFEVFASTVLNFVIIQKTIGTFICLLDNQKNAPH